MNGYEIESNFNAMFLKVNPDLKVAKGEEYTLMPIDEDYNNGIIVSNKNETNGLFKIVHIDEEGEQAKQVYSALPKVIRSKLESIKTLEDIETLSTSDTGYQLYKHTDNNEYIISFKVPMRFKQTKGLGGYQTNNVIYLGNVNAIYKYDANNKITKKTAQIYSYNEELGIIQGNDIPSYTKASDISKFQSTDEQRSCINTNDQGKIITEESQCTPFTQSGWSGTYTLVPYFANKVGTVNLKITNTVNGLARYNASKDNKLQYRIEVTNTGNAFSVNNTIVTSVPKLVEVDTKSISNNGVYNKKDHTISWNLENIAAGEKVQVYYRAVAPESAKGKELVGNSSVKSDQVTSTVRSTNTVVTLERIVEIIKNPDTGTMIHFVNTNITIPVNFVISFVLIISIISFLIVRKFHLKKEKTTN